MSIPKEQQSHLERTKKRYMSVYKNWMLTRSSEEPSNGLLYEQGHLAGVLQMAGYGGMEIIRECESLEKQVWEEILK